MCLPNFIRFENISEVDAMIGYRTWRNKIDNLELKSENQNYIWLPEHDKIGHEVTESNSGIYAYNYYNYYNNNYNNNNYYNYNNNNNYNNNYNNYNNNYNNYYYYYYYLSGIIKQHGRVAIHKVGQRSEFAKIEALFTIRESDASGPNKFINWIKEFNFHIGEVAKRYNTNTIHWQDFFESKSNKTEKE